MPAQGSVRIWWDDQVQAYRMTSPYNAAFVDLLKAAVPNSDRSWEKATKIWTFSEKWLDPIKALCDKCYAGGTTVISKQDAQRAQVPPSVQSASLPTMYQQFFDLVPYEAMRRAYLTGIAQHHPDKGGDATKASQLNAIWQKLEKDFYKKGGNNSGN